MILLLIISVIWISSEITLSQLMRSDTSKVDYDKCSLKIIWITITVSIITGMMLQKTNIIILESFFSIVYYSGVGLICCGLIIRWIAILTLKKAFTVDVSISKDQTLVKSGIYTYIRHPSYLGSLLSFLGLGIVFNNWITFAVIFIPILISFLYRISIEEKVLIEAFGNQYREYVEHSNRLIPGIY